MRYLKESFIFLWLFFCLFFFIAAPRNFSELKSQCASLASLLLLRPNWNVSSPSKSTYTQEESEELAYLRMITRKQQLEIFKLKENLLQIEHFKNTYPQNSYQLVFADVLHYDLSSHRRSLYLNKGYQEGVRKGVPVLKGEALIGEVVEVGKSKSRVRLIHDASSEIRIALMRSESTTEGSTTTFIDQGLLKGDGETLKIEWLPMDITLQGNETVVTSMRSPFGKGLMIGTLKDGMDTDRTLFHDLEVTPLTSLDSIQNVTLLLVDSPSLRLFQYLEKAQTQQLQANLETLLEECYRADLDEVEPKLRLNPKQIAQLGDWFIQIEKKYRTIQCYEKALERHQLASKEDRFSRTELSNLRQKLKLLEEHSQ